MKKAWLCIVCGYVHEGDEPPEACPVCGAGPSDFQPVEAPAETPGAEASSAFSGRIVIVGGGVAGVFAAEAARRQAPQAEIVLFSAEPHLPYYRLNLSRYLAGEVTKEDLPIHPEAWYAEQRIAWRGGVSITGLDAASKTVTTASGGVERADALVLCAGAVPFRPPFEGVAQEGVLTLRTTEDADRILDGVKAGQTCACIGGGILGIEAAGALARQGARVTLIENGGWLMPRQLNEKAAEQLALILNDKHIHLEKQFVTQAITRESGGWVIRSKEGRTVRAGQVLIAAGIRSSLGLARQAGLDVNNGVVVNAQLQTSAPGIFAAGDVAEFQGVVSGLWNVAQYQGAIAGANAAGAAQVFGGIPRSNVLKVLGVDLLSLGQIEKTGASDRVIEASQPGVYDGFIFQKNLLAGAILLGDSSIGAALKKAIEEKTDLGGLLQSNPTAADVRKHFQ